MAAAPLAAEALLDGVGVAPGDRQPDQVGEGVLDRRALGVREGVPMVASASTMTRSARRTTMPSSMWCTSRGPDPPDAHGRWSCRVPMTT